MSRDIPDGRTLMWVRSVGFSGPVGSAWWSSGAVVAAVGVDGELADDLAGVAVDDSDVEVVDEEDDAGSVEGSAESDVVHVAVVAEADASVADAVVADAQVGRRAAMTAETASVARSSPGGCRHQRAR
jgi:hypothetical protein